VSDWPFIAPIVTTICIGLAYLVAQEHMYILCRTLVVIGMVVLFLKIRQAASSLERAVRRAVSLISFVVLALFVVLGFLIVREMENSLLRAYLHVDGVSIEIQKLDLIGGDRLPPASVTAHISGHNVSTSVPTLPNPIIQASIAFRPPAANLSEEAALFTKATWANEGYMGYHHVLNPLETFSFSKTQSLISEDAIPFSFETWKKLSTGEYVIYVVTRAIYADKWGPLPEVHTCSSFGAKTNFKRYGCMGTYQQ
jgi:hypothetical protein